MSQRPRDHRFATACSSALLATMLFIQGCNDSSKPPAPSAAPKKTTPSTSPSSGYISPTDTEAETLASYEPTPTPTIVVDPTLNTGGTGGMDLFSQFLSGGGLQSIIGLLTGTGGGGAGGGLGSIIGSLFGGGGGLGGLGGAGYPGGLNGGIPNTGLGNSGTIPTNTGVGNTGIGNTGIGNTLPTNAGGGTTGW